MPNFHYVYILKSVNAEHRYTGITSDLQKRLKKHNSSSVPHTTKHAPWEIETAIAFKDKMKAAEFEKYLKSGSGREFARRHF